MEAEPDLYLEKSVHVLNTVETPNMETMTPSHPVLNPLEGTTSL